MTTESKTDRAQFRTFDRYNLECTLPCIAKDGDRSYAGVCFETDRTVATNGHIMVEVPFPEVDPECLPEHLTNHRDGTNGDRYIMAKDAATAALKAIPKRAKDYYQVATLGVDYENRAEVRATDLTTPSSFTGCGLEGSYPDYKAVRIDKGSSKCAMRVCLGVPVLESLLKAAKAGTKAAKAGTKAAKAGTKASALPRVTLYLQELEQGAKNNFQRQAIGFEFQIGTDETRMAEGVFMPIINPNS